MSDFPVPATCSAGHGVWVDISDPEHPAVAIRQGYRPGSWVECERKGGEPRAPFCPRCGGELAYE